MLHLFGPPRVEEAPTELSDSKMLVGEKQSASSQTAQLLDSKKPNALLIYLAATGTWVDRNYLASLFWGDSEEKKARSSLRQALYYLKKLGWDSAFRLEKTRVQLNLTTDVDLFKEKLDLQDYQTIAQLAKAPFLENYSTGIEAFDQWVQLERQTLDGIWREAVLQFSRTASSKDLPEAISLLNVALERDPFSEEVIQQMLKLSM